jgi:tRNA-(ms[2]io[6]A)-hydroxylase
MAVIDATPPAIAAFVQTKTPDGWVREARRRLPELLLDHANCELKAASTALGFLYRYPERSVLVQRMSRLAREELRHFEQVRRLLAELSVPFERLSASRYAATLRQAVRQEEPQRLLDLLLVGALIEARSCERFAALVPHLPVRLAGFYRNLLAAEARHFEQYLAFVDAEVEAGAEVIGQRLAELQAIEAALISEPDTQFRFHSGVPSGPGSSN